MIVDEDGVQLSSNNGGVVEDYPGSSAAPRPSKDSKSHQVLRPGLDRGPGLSPGRRAY